MDGAGGGTEVGLGGASGGAGKGGWRVNDRKRNVQGRWLEWGV